MKRLERKTKRCVYKAVLLLLILLLLLCVVGCEQNFEGGNFSYTFSPYPIMAGAKSDTDTFAKDNVSFELYYGVYDVEYYEKHNIDPKGSYSRSHLEGAKIFFAMYACDADLSREVLNDMEIEDYKNIKNHYFLKEISEEEAFSEEYGFTMSYLQGITYNHHETISIPMEIFTKEEGTFVIKLIAFQVVSTDGESYYTTVTGGVGFGYEMIDEDTVKILFK